MPAREISAMLTEANMSNDPWYRCEPGSYGHPKIKNSGPTFARNDWWANRGELRATNEDGEGGLYDRASAALSFGSNDSRFSVTALMYSFGAP
jgi:hypothetical protein